LEYGSPSLLQNITIAGYASPIANYYTNAFPPGIGANEVAIDPKGFLMFSPTDAGKSISGSTYSYVAGSEAYPGPISSNLLGIKGLCFGYDETSFLTSVSNVTGLTDITGNSFNAVAGPTAPTYIASDLNSFPSCSFLSSPRTYMEIASSAGLTNGKLIEDLTRGFTFVGVVNVGSLAASGQRKSFISLYNFNNYNTVNAVADGINVGYDAPSNDGVCWSSKSQRLGFSETTRATNTTTYKNDWHIVIISVQPNGVTHLRVNATPISTSAPLNGRGVYGQFNMETREHNYINYNPIPAALPPSNTSAYSGQWKFSCLYFYNVALNIYECLQIETALKTKYALPAF
jgi:hypothetical protein